MKKYRICGRKSPDCQSTVSTAVMTATGLEEVHVNMDTGEITYSPPDCQVDEDKFRQAVRKAGYELEEID